jgi:hypothetical protein
VDSQQDAEKLNFSHGFTRMHKDKCFGFSGHSIAALQRTGPDQQIIEGNGYSRGVAKQAGHSVCPSASQNVIDLAYCTAIKIWSWKALLVRMPTG